MGKDSSIDATMNMDRKTLVGKLISCKVGQIGVGTWISYFGGKVIAYSPTFQVLFKGWIGFCFKLEEDAQKILEQQWYWDSCLMVLKLWMPLFNTT